MSIGLVTKLGLTITETLHKVHLVDASRDIYALICSNYNSISLGTINSILMRFSDTAVLGERLSVTNSSQEDIETSKIPISMEVGTLYNRREIV